MSRLEVTRENRICGMCGQNGHNTGSSICQHIGTPIYRTKCSRCNQPGHNRSNRRKCSLFNEYPNYCYLTNSNAPPPSTHYEPGRSIWWNGANPPRVHPIVVPIPVDVPLIEHEPFVIDTNTDFIVGSIAHRRVLINYKIDELKDKLFRLIERHRVNNNNSVCLYHECLITLFSLDITRSSDSDLNHHTQTIQIIEQYINTQTPQVPSSKRILKITKIIDSSYENPTMCAICFEDKEFNTFCETNCNHKVCVSCMGCLIKNRSDNIHTPIKCPMCRSNIISLSCYHDEDINTINNAL